MLLGQLTTVALQDHNAEQTEIGQFTLDVNIGDKQFAQSVDKLGLVKNTIASYLASAILDTEVPREYWVFQATAALRNEFRFPPIITFGR